VVGDDLTLDLTPAHQLGLQTWWITDHLATSPAQKPDICTQYGSLNSLLNRVKQDNF
jgi:FMN phosphatase YigB (HAD superfamily)